MSRRRPGWRLVRSHAFALTGYAYRPKRPRALILKSRDALDALYRADMVLYRAMVVEDACDTLSMRASNAWHVDETTVEASRLIQAVFTDLEHIFYTFESYAHRCAEAEARLRCGWRPPAWETGE